MIHRRRGAAVWSLVVPLALVALAGDTFGQTAGDGHLAAIESETTSLQGRLNQLRTDFLYPEELSVQRDFTTRFAEGQLRYILEEYDAAATILVDVVENPDFRAHVGFDTAVYLLADSLHLDRNFILARGYFEQLIESESRQHSLDAARRLLEIAFALNQYDGLEVLYRSFERRGGAGVGDELAYVRGKALYFQERFPDAITAFGAVTARSDLYDRARYFTGVAHVRLGQLDRASAEFDGVIGRLAMQQSLDDELSDVLDLAYLAKGRVQYERGEWLDASATYNEVPRSSPYFDAALYEIAWTLIREERYENAINNLEVLMLVADPSGRFATEARLLRGDLLLRLERYEDAIDDFEYVADRFFPVEQDLLEIAERHEDPRAFFEALVNPETGALRLPTDAMAWVRSDSSLDRVLTLATDAVALQAAIAESRQLIGELDAALNQGSRVDAFPRLREGWTRTIEVQNDGVMLAVALVEYERGLLWGRLSGPEQSEYEALRSRRAALQARVENLPRTFAEVDEREAVVVGALGGMVLEVYRAEQEVAMVRSELAALRTLLDDQAQEGEISRDELLRMRAELDTADRELDVHLNAARALRNEINVRQVHVGVADDVGSAERALRQQLLAALGSEAAFLADRRHLAADRTSDFSRADRQRAALAEIDAGIEAFFVAVDRLVAQQTVEYRALLEEERANVSLYERILAEVTAESELVSGQVAYGAFRDVQVRFSELTLRANLGVLDVAWRQKEDLTDRIDTLFDERNQAIRVLDADFAELLLTE